jgi:hypothetical protein
MHGDRSSAGDPRPLRRPPYGLPMRRRTTLYEDPGSPAESPSPDALASHRDASILGRNPHWPRMYSTPTPPGGDPHGLKDRWLRPVLIAGFLSCLVLGMWSGVPGVGTVSPETGVVPTPNSRPQTTGHTKAITPRPTLTSTSRLRPSAMARPERKNAMKTSKNRATPSGRSHGYRNRTVRHTEQNAAGRQRSAKKAKRGDHGGRIGKGSSRSVAAKCDRLFPPSAPKFRVRNRVCHQIYG